MGDCRPLIQIFYLTWISRLLIPDKITTEPWKSIPSHFFKKYNGPNFLLRCNYNQKFVEKSGIPVFNRKMLANFLEIRCFLTNLTNFGFYN